MTEEEYAERYLVLYHEKSLSEVRYDEYHPQCMKLIGQMVIYKFELDNFNS